MTRQIDSNSDFTVGAVQQVRDELNGRIDAMGKQLQQQASNAGGVSKASSSSKGVPLVNNQGRPDKIEVKTEQFSMQCSFCDGEVPKPIAKHCKDCDLHFHPGHLQRHRDEWPCPLVDRDLCPWCADHINEEDNVLECDVCHYYTTCQMLQ